MYIKPLITHRSGVQAKDGLLQDPFLLTAFILYPFFVMETELLTKFPLNNIIDFLT